jgi:hypothetical protein
MEKQLSAIGYWLGLVCTVLALILRFILGSSRRQCHFSLEFLSRCCTVFLVDDCELVPHSEVLSSFAHNLVGSARPTSVGKGVFLSFDLSAKASSRRTTGSQYVGIASTGSPQ